MNLDAISAAIAALDEYGGRVCIASNEEAAVDAIKPFKQMPVCVIFGITERAGQNEVVTGGPRHKVTVSIRIVTAARDAADMLGYAAYRQAQTARKTLVEALLGLVPDTNHSQMQYVSGGMIYAQAGLLLWLDEFTTHYYMRAKT